jgi:monovalent cation/hydrogen antiporter
MHEYLTLYPALIMLISFLILLARKLGISYPIVLVISGIIFSLIPGTPSIRIDPDIVFLIILPPVLFEAAHKNSWKAIWHWRRMISVMALGFVLLTSALVAVVSVWLVPGLTLSEGFLLGAIISPPDAAAAIAILRKVKLPKGLVAILEGESLLNDASSLTIFRFALAAIVTNKFIWYDALGSFTLVTVSGIAIGVTIGLMFYALFKWLPTTANLDLSLSLALPYLCYLTAERLGSSGVLAVVTAGLLLGQENHFVIAHTSRLKSNAVWPSITFIMNAVLFFLIGIQFPEIVKGLKQITFFNALNIAMVISVLVILVRVVAANLTGIFTSFISRYFKVAVAHPGWRNPMITSLAGMRGVVSLASALSIPLILPGGTPFPFRSLLLFITFVVIIVTLVGQGLALPWLINVIKPDAIPGERDNDEQLLAIDRYLLNATLEKLQTEFRDDVAENMMLKNKQDLIVYKLAVFDELDQSQKQKSDIITMIRHFKTVMMELTEQERQALYEFQSVENFDDDIIRIIEKRLDLEEERLEDNPD